MQRWKFSKPVIDQVYEDLIGAKDEISYPKNIKINNIDIKNLFFFLIRKPKKKILERVDLKINSGDKILIIGDSGAGKSTFFRSSCRFTDSDSGRINVNDNYEIGEKFNLTNSLSYVSQKIFIFNKKFKRQYLFIY